MVNVTNPKAFPGWKNVPVVDLLSKRLPFPIHLENNATAAAVGEYWYGAGQGISTFFYIFFSVGLGGGLIINGHPFEGFTGNAGELGYFPAAGETDPLAVFNRPHLGIYFNLPRLYKQLQEHGIQVSQPSELNGLYEQEVPELLDWLEVGARHLAPLILAIEYLIDPEAIFFGGRLPDALICNLMDRLDHLLPSLRIEDKRTGPALRRATSGVDAAALGLATLPMYTSFAPAPRLLIKGSAQK